MSNLKRRVTSERKSISGTITADDLRKAFKIPKGADIFVNIPTGADWSGMKLFIDEAPITVNWEQIT